MANDDKIQEVDRRSGDVKKSPRFDDRDWKLAADYVIDEYKRRQVQRNDRERQWEEIDRQVRMEPSVAFKMLPDGTVDWKKKWMAETELPLQAQALGVLTTDARSMLFSDSGDWFRAHSEVTDEYLRNVEGVGGIRILGDENYIPSLVNQDEADKIVAGFLLHYFRQYDHPGRFDVINAESFTYGVGIGRARLETKNIWIYEARGVRTEKQRIPTIVPCSIKNVYLEEPRPTLHSATVLGPAHIAVDYLKYESLAMAANKGSTDPDDEEGGWMPKNFQKISPEKNGYIKVLEMEGDIVIPRKTVRSIVLRGAIITVAMGGTDAQVGTDSSGYKTVGGTGSNRAVVRFRFRRDPFSTYLLFPYMHESADSAYPTSPLMKGRTVQMTATDAVNRFLDAAMLKNTPPVGYDRNDPVFAQTGGPEIYPNALWPSTEPVTVHANIGGDPGSLAQAALQFINLYAELTGVLPSRLGARTVSHTTAHAKESELQRGASRIVDYVNATGHGPMTGWLNMAYILGRRALKGTISLYIDAFRGYVEIDKSMLPERASFEWLGAGGPQEKQQKAAAKIGAAMQALNIDALRVKMGQQPRIDTEKMIDSILREGGWTNIEELVNETKPGAGGPPAIAPPAPGVPGPAPGGGGPAAPPLQAIGGGRG